MKQWLSVFIEWHLFFVAIPIIMCSERTYTTKTNGQTSLARSDKASMKNPGYHLTPLGLNRPMIAGFLVPERKA
jgi:hypothetical protein